MTDETTEPGPGTAEDAAPAPARKTRTKRPAFTAEQYRNAAETMAAALIEGTDSAAGMLALLGGSIDATGPATTATCMGVRAESTAGRHMALTNWCAAARRRVLEINAGEA